MGYEMPLYPAITSDGSLRVALQRPPLHDPGEAGRWAIAPGREGARQDVASGAELTCAALRSAPFARAPSP